MKLVKSLAASCMLLLAALVALAEITKAPPGTYKVVGPMLFTNSILPEKKELAFSAGLDSSARAGSGL